MNNYIDISQHLPASKNLSSNMIHHLFINYNTCEQEKKKRKQKFDLHYQGYRGSLLFSSTLYRRHAARIQHQPVCYPTRYLIQVKEIAGIKKSRREFPSLYVNCVSLTNLIDHQISLAYTFDRSWPFQEAILSISYHLNFPNRMNNV